MGIALTNDEIVVLEQTAFRAWPAAEIVDIDGWRLRATGGVTRRANSAWTIAATGTLSIDERIARAEAFYSARHLPPCFHVAPISQPVGLDSALASRGYVLDAPVSIQVTALDQIKIADERDGLRCEVSERYSDDWLWLSTKRGRFGDVTEVYRGILDRLDGRTGFALVRCGDEPIAIGLSVIDGAWAGFFNMLTMPEARRRGAARQVLRGLSRWAGTRGASRAYLQVERAAVGAMALYAGLGFEELYGYHYRVIPKTLIGSSARG